MKTYKCHSDLQNVDIVAIYLSLVWFGHQSLSGETTCTGIYGPQWLFFKASEKKRSNIYQDNLLKYIMFKETRS